MAGISRRALTGAVKVRLDGVADLTVYRGEVPAKPPVIQTDDEDDDSLRVAPYAVLYPSPGTPSPAGQEYAETYTSLDWLIQVTVAAGYSEDAEAAVDRVDNQLLGWAPTIASIACDALRPPLGFDPGPMRRSDEVEPPRFYLPLQYVLTATR